MLRAPEHNPEKLQALRTRTCSKRATTTDDSGGFMVTFAAQVRGNVSKRRNPKEAPQLNGLQAAAIDIFATPGKKIAGNPQCLSFARTGRHSRLDICDALRFARNAAIGGGHATL
jgi:hypothetical protein